jgi:hypothetical protein
MWDSTNSILTVGDGSGTQYIYPSDFGAASTQAFGDAAASGSNSVVSRRDHVHGMPALGTTAAAIGTSAGGSATTPSKSDHVHATGAGTPSTQAMGDAAATGSGPAAAMTDHKHAMPTLGFGLTSNSTPAVSLTNEETFATAETTLSTASYADISGATTSSLAAGTWLILATINGRVVNAHALMVCAITNAANTVMANGVQSIPASGSASVNAHGQITLSAIVTGGTSYKLRGARGNTTLTTSWIAMDGASLAVSNNASDNTDKGTSIRAIRLA